MVKAKYQAYVANMGSQDVELTEARVKMASFPEGSTPIRNPVGTAPGMQVELKDTTLIALPGVPHEMEAIFDGTILPQLRKASNGAAFYDENLYVDIMESSLAPLIEIVMQESPGIYIKSHPQGEERQPHIELHFSTTSSNAMEAQERLRKAVAKLADLIRSNNGRVYSKEHNSNQGQDI
jgi:molybdopterin-biosynthesis enzyme MoeA-like protein